MTERLTSAENVIIRIGIFLIFLVLFGRFVWSEIGPVIGPLFHK